MTTQLKGLGLNYLTANPLQRASLTNECESDGRRAQIVEYFSLMRIPYEDIAEFRDDLGLLSLASKWFEPRDIGSFAWEIGSRASKLPLQLAQQELENVAYVLDETVKATNIGAVSTRDIVFDGLMQSLHRHRA